MHRSIKTFTAPCRNAVDDELACVVVQQREGRSIENIVHKEMHHGLWSRYGSGITIDARLENYVENVTQRFARMKGYNYVSFMPFADYQAQLIELTDHARLSNQPSPQSYPCPRCGHTLCISVLRQATDRGTRLSINATCATCGLAIARDSRL